MAAGAVSDPYLMTGYDRKTVEISHDVDEPVEVTLEVDCLADGSWQPYKVFLAGPGRTVRHTFPRGYSAHWVRARANRACRITVQFDYTAFCDGRDGMEDLACLSGHWLRPAADCAADLTTDAAVDVEDLRLMARNWLGG